MRRHLAHPRSAQSSSVWSQPTTRSGTPVQRQPPVFPPLPREPTWSPAAASSHLDEDEEEEQHRGRVHGRRGRRVSRSLPHLPPPRVVIDSSHARNDPSQSHIDLLHCAAVPRTGPPRVSFVEDDAPPCPASRNIPVPNEQSRIPPQYHQHLVVPTLDGHSGRLRPQQPISSSRSGEQSDGTQGEHGRRSSIQRRGAVGNYTNVYGFSPQSLRANPSMHPLQHAPPRQSFLGGTPPVSRHQSFMMQVPPLPPERPGNAHLPPLISHFSPSSPGMHPLSAVATFQSEGRTRAPNFEDLFFDLLFVANLAVYSGAVDLATMAQVRGFLGFFMLLWWTWYTQSLFDVRFRTRHGMRKGNFVYCCQILTRLYQIGVYVAFTTTAGQFARGDFRSFSKIYSLNRSSLALDYAVIWIDMLREERKPSGWTGHSPGGTSATRVVHRSVGPLVGFASNASACVIWGLSSRMSMREDSVRQDRFVVWVAATILEMFLLFVAEWRCQFTSLRHTHVCERLALFAIVILGEGYSALGQVLNSLAPGLKIKPLDESSVHSVRNDGWDADVMMQTTAAVLILCCAFITYYRDAAIELRHSSSLVILTWSYLHIIYFAATALLVVGLKRLIGFHNTFSCATTFLNAPTKYLPPTQFYAHVGNTAIAGLLGHETDGSLYRPPHNGSLATPEGHVYAVMSVIQGFSGAWIPSVNQALALVRSTIPIITTDVGPTLKSQIPNYMQYIDTLKNVQTMDGLILDHLFEFEYVYCSVAIIYICDCFIKGIQAGKAGIKDRIPTLTVRFGTGLTLLGIQVLYIHYPTYPSWGIINGGMPILAAVMLAEIATQMCMEWYLTRARRRREVKDEATTIAYWRQKGEKELAAEKDEEGRHHQAMGLPGEKQSWEGGHAQQPLHVRAGVEGGAEEGAYGQGVPYGTPAVAAAGPSRGGVNDVQPPTSTRAEGSIARPERFFRRLTQRPTPKPYARFLDHSQR